MMRMEEVASRALMVIATFCFVANTDGVAPRRSRYQSSSLAAKARLAASQARITQSYMMGRSTLTTPFTPSITKCCKVGEAAAKKKVSCQADDYESSKVKNRMNLPGSPLSEVYRYAKVLLYRAEKCALSKYAGNFQKCCQFRQRFQKEFKDCARHRRGIDRRKCRDRVRMRYAA